MEQVRKIELSIPTIDLSLLKKLKGGYTFYGGELDPAYCYADGPSDNYPDAADDGWRPEFDFADPSDFQDYDFSKDDEDSAHEGNNKTGDSTDIHSCANINIVNFTQEQTQAIINAINNLPNLYQNLTVTITPSNQTEGSGQFTPGYISITIDSNGIPNVSALHEELNHFLQYQRYGDEMLTHSHSAYEYQAKMLEDLVQYSSGMLVDDFLSFLDGSDNNSLEFWLNCFGEENFNKSYFIDHAADFYDEFVNYYNSIDNPGDYGSQYDPDFDWDWEYWLNLFDIK